MCCFDPSFFLGLGKIGLFFLAILVGMFIAAALTLVLVMRGKYTKGRDERPDQPDKI